MNVRLFPVLVLIGGLAAPLAAQQPWSSGRPDGHAPIGVMGDHTHGAGEIMLSYRFMTMQMDGNLDGTDQLTPEQIVAPEGYGYMVTPIEMPMRMHMLGAMYAPSDRLTLMAMVPWVSMDMEHRTRPGGTFTTEASGLGDIQVGGMLELFNRDRNAAHVNFGVSVPTGSIDERDETPMSNGEEVRLPYPMQIGSGTVDLLSGLTYLGQSERLSWGAQGMSTVRLGENDNGYTFGNRVMATAWGAWRWAEPLSSSLRIEGQGWGDVEGADPVLNPMMVPTADPELRAGQRVELLLGTNFEVMQGQLKGQRLAVEFGLPVYQSLDGPQLETDWTLTAGWQYAF